jgi:sphingolipid delta-4 desaturase
MASTPTCRRASSCSACATSSARRSSGARLLRQHRSALELRHRRSTFQIFFYALRPGFVRVQRFTRWHGLNFLVQGLFDYALIALTDSYRPLLYLVLSSFLAGSLHPCAAHFIAEHYVFERDGQETFSYYGPLNALTYNVGYHNEHHDFPSVPWTRLPALHRAAREFYEPLPWHPSWVMVTVRFIFDDAVGLFSRVKRPPRAAQPLPPAAVVQAEGGKGDLGGILD